MVWHIAALQRSKKLPKLERLWLREPGRKQSWQKQFEIAKQWVANADKQREDVNGR